MPGGTERIDIIITDNGTVKGLRDRLLDLAKTTNGVFAGLQNHRADNGNAGQGIHSLALRVKKGGDQMVRRAAMGASQAVIISTPVDKGTARSNWVAQLNNDFTGTLPAGDREGSERIAANQALIEQYDGDYDDEIHITNNLRYITPLNQGWSEQAPAGFVDDALHAASEIVRTLKNGIVSDG